MKAEVDSDLCISCGLCVNTCPEVFVWDDNEKAKAMDVPVEAENDVDEAIEGCPTSAISQVD